MILAIYVPAADRAAYTRYLLGQLNETEQTQVEDRFTSDPKCFEMYQEVERSLLVAYASGDLEPDEAALFEQNYLITGERRKQLAIVRALLEVQSAPAPSPVKRLIPVLVFAAVLVVIVAVYLMPGRSPKTPEKAVNPPPVQPVPQRAPEVTPVPQVAREVMTPPVAPDRTIRKVFTPPMAVRRATVEPSPVSPIQPPPLVPVAPPESIPFTAQSPAVSAPPSPIQARQSANSNDVDQVIALFKAGAPERVIVEALRDQSKPTKMTLNDLMRLKEANVPENIIVAMRDPSSAVAPVVTPTAPSRPAVTAKKRTLINEFDYSSVRNQVQAIFGTQQNIGEGIRALLAKRVADSKQVVVVERQKIDMIQKEQDRNAGNRVKQEIGAKIGRIRGADAILMGEIVVFGRDDKPTKKLGSAIGGSIGSAMGGRVNSAAAVQASDKAVIGINYRLVNAETGNVIAAGEVRGESTRKSKGWRGLVGTTGKSPDGEVDMTSYRFAETIIGEATLDAVDKLAVVLDRQVPEIKHADPPVEAYIVDVNGNSVMIAAGTNDGVSVGEVFEVLRVVREVKDPVTKETLDRVTEPVGSLTISNVRDRTSTGTYTGAPIQAGTGFIARKKLK